MTKFVSVVNSIVDVVYLYDPRPAIDVVVAPDGVFAGWLYSNGAFTAPPPLELSLEGIRLAKLAAITAAADALLAAGAPIEGDLHVRLVPKREGEQPRADLAAMGAVAIGAMAGMMAWPETYALGWITEENIRHPLPTPQAGAALAERVGAYFAAVVQHARDLKDAAIAAEDEAALAAIDIAAGWPAS